MITLPTAVFLDRDGTIIEDLHYLSDPDRVRLLPGAAEAIARINTALVPVIVVTNQSGIGRGYFGIEDLEAVSERLAQLLAAEGAHIDASYHCPHAPSEGCDCRKPGLELFRRAADDLAGVDLGRSLYVGDRFRDIAPALFFGGHGVLVPSPETPTEELERALREARTAGSLGQVVDWYLCTN